MSDLSEAQLAEHCWSLHAAVLRVQGLRRRQATPGDPLLAQHRREAEQAVAAAKAGLHRALLAEGWSPPAHVVELLLDGAIPRQAQRVE